MMMFLRLVTVVAACFGLFGNIAHAQLRIDITEGQVAPTPIAIANFTGPDGAVSEVGKQIAQIISEDLESSGLFAPVDSAAFIEPPPVIFRWITTSQSTNSTCNMPAEST